MTPARPGSDHGRGGQAGREPRATVQARGLRVLERSVAGLSQREIVAKEGISQSAVSKILQRLEARVLEELVGRVEQQKVRQTLCLDHLYRESLRAWEASKADATRRVQKKTQPGVGAPSATVAQFVVDTQHGDPRYLEVARKASSRDAVGLYELRRVARRAALPGPADPVAIALVLRALGVSGVVNESHRGERVLERPARPDAGHLGWGRRHRQGGQPDRGG